VHIACDSQAAGAVHGHGGEDQSGGLKLNL